MRRSKKATLSLEFGLDVRQPFFGQLVNQFGVVGKAFIALAEQVHGDRPACCLVGIAGDELEQAGRGGQLLTGQEPPDRVRAVATSLEDLDLRGVILGDGEGLRGLEAHVVLAEGVQQGRGERAEAQQLANIALRLAEPQGDIGAAHAAVTQRGERAHHVGRVHLFALEVLGQRQFNRFLLGPHVDGNEKAGGDDLALLEHLQGAVALATGVDLELPIFLRRCRNRADGYHRALSKLPIALSYPQAQDMC